MSPTPMTWTTCTPSNGVSNCHILLLSCAFYISFPHILQFIAIRIISNVTFSHNWLIYWQWSTLFVVNSAVITYNAALNRPAYLSSVFTRTYGTYPAHYANDGNRHTTWNTNPHCAATNYEANPWWAVDLGHQMEIYSVYLTSSFYNESRKKHSVSGSDLLNSITSCKINNVWA